MAPTLTLDSVFRDLPDSVRKRIARAIAPSGPGAVSRWRKGRWPARRSLGPHPCHARDASAFCVASLRGSGRNSWRDSGFRRRSISGDGTGGRAIAMREDSDRRCRKAVARLARLCTIRNLPPGQARTIAAGTDRRADGPDDSGARCQNSPRARSERWRVHARRVTVGARRGTRHGSRGRRPRHRRSRSRGSDHASGAITVCDRQWGDAASRREAESLSGALTESRRAWAATHAASPALPPRFHDASSPSTRAHASR